MFAPTQDDTLQPIYDTIIIGSGFGGSMVAHSIGWRGAVRGRYPLDELHRQPWVHGHIGTRFSPWHTKRYRKEHACHFTYTNGAVGTLYYSWEIPSLFRGLRLSRIFGREGSITFESNGLFIFVNGVKKRLIIPNLTDIAGYKAMFQDFIKSLRSGEDPQMTLDLAQQDLRRVESVYQSLNNSLSRREILC